MKNIVVLISLVGLICICTNGFADDLNKKIVGKWYNPYTYASTGEKKGFHFKRNGVCKALGTTLDLRKWHIKDGRLFIKGFYKDKETGKWEIYDTSEYIETLNSDSLFVLADPEVRLGFLYMSPKALKKNVIPRSVEMKIK